MSPCSSVSVVKWEAGKMGRMCPCRCNKGGMDVSRWQQVKWAVGKVGSSPSPGLGSGAGTGDASLCPCAVSSVGIRTVEKDRDRDVWVPNQPGSSCTGSPSCRDVAPGEGEQRQEAQEQLQAVEEEQDGTQERFQAQGICLDQQVVHSQHSCWHCKCQAEGQWHLPLAQVPLGAYGTQRWDQIMEITEGFGWGGKFNVLFPWVRTPSTSPGCNLKIQGWSLGLPQDAALPVEPLEFGGTHRRRCVWPQCRGRGGAAPRPAPSWRRDRAGAALQEKHRPQHIPAHPGGIGKNSGAKDSPLYTNTNASRRKYVAQYQPLRKSRTCSGADERWRPEGTRGGHEGGHGTGMAARPPEPCSALALPQPGSQRRSQPEFLPVPRVPSGIPRFPPGPAPTPGRHLPSPWEPPPPRSPARGR